MLAKAADPTRAQSAAVVTVDGAEVSYGQLMQEASKYCAKIRKIAVTLDDKFHRQGTVMQGILL